MSKKYKLVPVEPTEDMVDAGRSQSSFPLGVYKAMIAAAPAVQGEPVARINGERLQGITGDQGRRFQQCWLNHHRTDEDDTPLYTAPQPATDAALLEAFDAGRRAAQADSAELAGALDEMIDVAQRVSVCGSFPSATILRAIDAIAAYRKQGGDT